ncbi:unnamed protein product, partial [Mesorhabditis spiculigera]
MIDWTEESNVNGCYADIHALQMPSQGVLDDDGTTSGKIGEEPRTKKNVKAGVTQLRLKDEWPGSDDRFGRTFAFPAPSCEEQHRKEEKNGRLTGYLLLKTR